MAVASVEDVETALGRPISTDAEQAQVDWWLTGVELFIAARLGLVADLNEDLVKYVEVEAVASKIRRSGTAESSITVSVDDGSVTRRYENAVSSGDITDDLWHLLSPNTGSSSIRPGFDADTAMWPVTTVPASYDLDWQEL
ncbi:MAG: hypothetical protein ABIO16_00545 [Nocardioides sp.]